MPNVPNADVLISGYPKGDPQDVKAKIGGAVDADWITNTCAIRLSHSFNKAGEKIPGNVPSLNTVAGANKDRYAFRVKEFRKWLEQRYGKPTLAKSGTGTSEAPEGFAGKKGIICFVDCGWSDATGHLDLWDGEKCVGHGYFELAKQVLLWQSGPQTAAPRPSSPPSAGGGAKQGVVTASTLNVRSEPSTSSEIIGKLNRGEAVAILEKRSGFYRIGPDWWVSSSYVKVDEGAA